MWQQKTLAGIFYFEMQRSRNSLWEDPVYKFLRSKVVFNFKISSSLLGHYFSTLVLWFSSMCVQILDLIRQPWGLGILLRTEFRANNGVKFLIKREVFLILSTSVFTRYCLRLKTNRCESKGQLISKCLLDVVVSTKKPTKNF